MTRAERQSHLYPWDHARMRTRVPLRIVERFHRWRHRRLYAMLPPFYQDFYPIENAVSLTMQYAKHTIESGKAMDSLASKSLMGIGEMERTITRLRLALAAGQTGWNEDRVDDFMGKWFGTPDLAPSAMSDREVGG